MQFGPTPAGGRLALGQTPWGDYRVEWNARGVLIAQQLLPRRPESEATPAPDPLRFLDEPQRRLVAARRARCEPCPENQGLTALTVHCRGCGCAGLAFLHGACKLGRWPHVEQPPDARRPVRCHTPRTRGV